jgi:hypothetical protein
MLVALAAAGAYVTAQATTSTINGAVGTNIDLDHRRYGGGCVGRFLFGGKCALIVTMMISTQWRNCFEHGLVNTFDAMGKEMMVWAVEELGQQFLSDAAALQSGTKVKSPDAVKFRTGVWLFDSPIWHFIYRLCVHLAPHLEKDWAKGAPFIQWILANGKFNDNETHILGGLSAIFGSRNGVFWVRAHMICAIQMRARARAL